MYRENNRLKGRVIDILARFIICTMLILMAGSANAFDIGRDIPTDKRLHALSTYVITDMLHERCELSGLELFLWVNAIGISKELLDVAYGGKFDVNDLVANNAGYLCYNIIRLEW